MKTNLILICELNLKMHVTTHQGLDIEVHSASSAKVAAVTTSTMEAQVLFALREYRLKFVNVVAHYPFCKHAHTICSDVSLAFQTKLNICNSVRISALLFMSRRVYPATNVKNIMSAGTTLHILTTYIYIIKPGAESVQYTNINLRLESTRKFCSIVSEY